MPKIILVVTFLIVVILVSVAPSYADNFITPEMLQDAFRTQDIDEIRGVLDSVRKMEYKGEILPVLHDVWRNKREKYPKLEWATLNKPILRADIANVLSQAWRNGKIKLDVTDFHSANISMLDNEDIEVVEIALMTLEVFDDVKDVDKIAEIARKGQPGTFHVAISTLTLMCNAAAEKALITLIVQTKDAIHLQFIKETKQQTDAFKSKTAFCSRKTPLPEQRQEGS
ncbi:MAG: hypothetical protein OEY67_10630 [Gammaproteobacteria bacterium]|nr:hypothetical protein [Gammaproteobacteria bacterium]